MSDKERQESSAQRTAAVLEKLAAERIQFIADLIISRHEDSAKAIKVFNERIRRDIAYLIQDREK